MFSKRINVRITLLFSGLFALATLLLFAALFISMERSLSDEEERALNLKLLAYWALFQSGGIERFIQEVNVDSLLLAGEPFLLRISGANNQTLFMSAPQAWSEPALGRLAELDPLENLRIELSSAAPPARLLVHGLRMDEGHVLQIGVSTRKKEELLGITTRLFLLLFIPILALSAAAGFALSSGLLKPLRAITATVRDIIETGRLGTRVAVPARAGTGSRPAGDELSGLVGLLNRMLERTERLVNGLRISLDTVAHDLKTPLTRLRASAELALVSGDETARREALATAIEETDGLKNMLATLLDITEAESGAMKLDLSAFDLPAMLREVIDLYALAGEEKGLRLLYEGPETMTIRGDRFRLRQVAANLLDNAVKYSDDGGAIRLRVAADRDSAAVSIRVEDAGPGIRDEDRQRIWERLYRSADSRGKPGLGLGLTLAKAVVEAHRGTIQAENLPGGGAAFTVNITKL